MTRLGVLVVGQSPRPEIEEELRRLMPGTAVDLRGCLDGWSSPDLAALEPGSGDTLFTRLPSGEGVTLPKAEVMKAGSARLEELRECGVGGVLIMCTGDFPHWRKPDIVFAGDLLRGMVHAICPRGRLGVLTPLMGQVAGASARWSDATHTAAATALSPQARHDEIDRAAELLRTLEPDLLVLDCVSYRRETKEQLCRAVGRPAVLAVTAVMRATAEWLEGRS